METRVRHLWIAFGAILPLTCLLASAADSPSGPAGVVAEINGVKITLNELEQKRPGALFQARNNYYETIRKAIDEYTDDVLLEQQARKENLTVPQLLDLHVNQAAGKDPSEETIRVFYDSADTTEPYEKVRVQILDALRQRRVAKAKTAYLQSLRKSATIAVVMAPPRAPIAALATPPRGPANARVTLTEYADYECPYCQQIQPTIEKLETEFKGRLAFVYKDFPLPSHPNAQKAAEATRCADAQGKFWEYHDLLESSKKLDVASLKTHARQLKLDAAAFDACLDNGQKAEAVKAQATEAQALGVQGTPTFFINGRYFSGALSYERLRAGILEELGTAEGQPRGAANNEASRR